jgi:hypothetical protein
MILKECWSTHSIVDKDQVIVSLSHYQSGTVESIGFHVAGDLVDYLLVA